MSEILTDGVRTYAWLTVEGARTLCRVQLDPESTATFSVRLGRAVEPRPRLQTVTPTSRAPASLQPYTGERRWAFEVAVAHRETEVSL